ncbi:phage tail sheath C-terminal domain-containing protein [Tenacibaculum amylolyticum]|uniref:phage tail sheath C-terminal domain-containing protein n=1 Tax=Tenacibaculum amylolyticum TaxID=104269 RepID=UPI003893BE3A
MSAYKTPGVYVEEIVKFPPSVAQVETAIPAFIGYTETAKKKEDNDLIMKPTRITSMLEYEQIFGFADKETSIGVKITDTKVGGVPNRDILVTPPSKPSPFKMYYNLQMYFANGGGPCYIVAVNTYAGAIQKNSATPVLLGDEDEDLVGGLTEVAKVDEPTLLIFPDATSLNVDADFYGLYNKALAQCEKLQDRFTILDTYSDKEYDSKKPVEAFRSGISSIKNEIKYGAAYFPYINTILNYRTSNEDITITHINRDNPAAQNLITDQLNTINTTIAGKVNTVINATPGPNFSGSLADVYNYLYGSSDLNLNGSGTPASNVPNFDVPKPQTLVDKVKQLIADVDEVLDLKKSANKEANAAISALQDEAGTAADIADIQAQLTAFNNAFKSGSNEVETVNTALEKLANSLQKAIDDNSTTKIENLIHKNSSNILKEVEKLVTAAAIASPLPAAGSNSIFDNVVSTFGTLRTAIIDDPATVNILENIALDTNNGELHGRDLASIEQLDNATYHQILAEIDAMPLPLPPSSTMAGIYAKVDADRGVWKAPANVSLNYVIEPTVQISHDDQKDLNVDTVAGKSVNAIRAFAGKGNLVWGARTLAGNDNEWRYVSVRRFFNMAEESIKKATEQFVFEPNNKNTWVRVKAMVDNFLTQQWRAGALAGPTPEKAFYVSVGLGETMTAQDILEGNMIIEIGMAVVRPAEFIILKFSHKMQEA